MRRLFRRATFAAVILTFSIAASIPRPAPAQIREGQQMNTLPQAELDIVKVLMTQERAWNKGDLEGFATGYKNAPDTVFMGAEVYRGFDQMLSRYKRNYPDRPTMGVLTFSDLEPRMLGEDHAVVTGHFALERDKKHGGAASGLFSLVMEKTADGWKIIVDHTT